MRLAGTRRVRVSPRRERGLRGLDGGVDVLGAAARDAADDLLRGRVDDVESLAADGRYPLPINQVGIVCDECNDRS